MKQTMIDNISECREVQERMLGLIAIVVDSQRKTSKDPEDSMLEGIKHLER